MSTLEISILIVASAVLLGANLIASVRAVRRLGRFSIPYVLLIWLAPVIGALFVLAKIRPLRPARLLPINANTISHNPSTLQADPWPTVSGTTESHAPFRQ
ncbi:MAG: hypothetical protein IV108_06595 [Burkholderiales bacterium]|nr:hypothetical protein [Burkholderiales bacterium]